MDGEGGTVALSGTTTTTTTKGKGPRSLHGLGVLCGLAAGAWLGAAEAPTKLVNAGLSPFAISLCMVAGVFTARWTFPTLLKGTGFVLRDLMQKKHLIVWAVVAGALWAVANTLTVFAIRDVGLAVAFPLWNTNALVGILWGRLLFRELEGASASNIAKVVLGTLFIVASAVMLGFSTIHGDSGAGGSPRAVSGVLAAIGASLMWGTMYVPYRKAYLSGMNPLSFVTVFTFGEIGTMLVLTLALDPGALGQLATSKHLLFWLFLGGFVWVIGDIFQQFATKYLGIGRGIPLSNTNQLWGLAWGALVFGELASADSKHKLLVLAGSVGMILGALAISTAVASAREQTCQNEALERECARYGLDRQQVIAAQSGEEFDAPSEKRRWWDVAIVVCATGVFVWLGANAEIPKLDMSFGWMAVLGLALAVSFGVVGRRLWKQTGFS
jgi:drug/metabolite transporter (DMT)-like permease